MNATETNVIPIATITQPPRQFRIGSTNLADPDPSMSPKKVIELYSASYPALKFATLAEPRMEGEMLVIQATLPTVQTKGADIDPLDQLKMWMQTPTPTVTVNQRWSPVLNFISGKLNEKSQPAIDAFLLPLA